MRGSIKSHTVIHRYDWGWLRNDYKLDKYEAKRNEAGISSDLNFSLWVQEEFSQRVTDILASYIIINQRIVLICVKTRSDFRFYIGLLRHTYL